MDRTLINAYLTLKALIFSKVLCLKQKHKRKASFRLKATSVWEHRIYTVSQKNVLCQYSKYGPTNHAAASCLTWQQSIEQLSRKVCEKYHKVQLTVNRMPPNPEPPSYYDVAKLEKSYWFSPKNTIYVFKVEGG